MHASVWWVYVLLAHEGRTTYVGTSTDPDRRLSQHNGELPGGAKATRRGRPWTLAARYGPFATRSAASRAEYQVKKLRGRRRLSWRPGSFEA